MILLGVFFNDTATTEIYTLSLHDALPISSRRTGIPAATYWETLAGDRCRARANSALVTTLSGMAGPLNEGVAALEIGRAHVCTPVPPISLIPAFALKKKKQ